MREYIFRGKRKGDKEWQFGHLHIIEWDKPAKAKGDYIDYRILGRHNECWYVDPETVGQYTGLKDKNGVKIFEGDILERGNARGSVSYSDKLCRFVFRWKTYDKFRPDFFKECALADFAGIHLAEVIGNIHDNPELLNEGGKDVV